MAYSFYMDASALAKRYVPEKGFTQVNAIFDTIPAHRIHVLNIGTGEVMWILVRKRNSGAISFAEFAQAATSFDGEIIHAKDINKASVTSRLITGSFPLIVAHSINSTDALTLKSALANRPQVTPSGRRPGSSRIGSASSPRRPFGRAADIQSRNPRSRRLGGFGRALSTPPELAQWWHGPETRATTRDY